MLLKIERTILKKIKKNPMPNNIKTSSFNKYSKDELHEAFTSLKDRGFFSMYSANQDYSEFTYVLSPKGRYYTEYIFMKFLSNIIIPIIVALLTTVATLYLEKLIENNKPQNSTEYTSDYLNEDS